MDKRITPEEIVDAYKKHGLGLVRSTMYTGDCACGLGAYYYEQSKTIPFLDKFQFTYGVAEKDFGYDYEWGFIYGFDGVSIWNETNMRFDQGYEDGQNSYKACLEAGFLPIEFKSIKGAIDND